MLWFLIPAWIIIIIGIGAAMLMVDVFFWHIRWRNRRHASRNGRIDS